MIKYQRTISVIGGLLALSMSGTSYAIDSSVGARPRGPDTTVTVQPSPTARPIDPQTGQPYDSRLEKKFDNYNADNVPKDTDYGNGKPTVNQGAKSAQTMQMVGTAINTAAAVYFFSKCGPHHPFNCVAGGLSAATAAMMLQGAKDTQGSIDYSAYKPDDFDWPAVGGPGTGGTDGGTTDGGLVPTTTGKPVDPKIAELESKIRGVTNGLREKGYKISPDGRTVTTPDGKTVSGAALSSAEGMASLGMSPDQIKEMNAANQMLAAKAKEQAAKAGLLGAEEDGGGGGAGGRKGAARAEKEFNYASLFGKKDESKKKDAANVSGLSKQFGDSRIGVPQDNIFDMVRRQYVKQDGAQNFIQAQPQRQPMSAPRRQRR